MRWFGIEKAGIPLESRAYCEEWGPDAVRAYLSTSRDIHVSHDVAKDMRRWLKEQYDRAERRETWLITMEVAITILVAAELIMSVVSFFYGKPK
jgi:hypothetical protein